MPTSDQTARLSPPLTPRVLLVDDEPEARAALCRMVRGMGYEARVAVDGREALGYLREHPGEIQLLIADLLLPMMHGDELAERVRNLDPAISTVLTTTGTDRPSRQLLGDSRDLPILEKPVRFEPLYRLLAERLGPVPASPRP